MALFKRQFVSCMTSTRWLIIIAMTVGVLVVQYRTAFRPVWVLPDINPNFFNYMLLFNYFGQGSVLYLMLLPFLAALSGGSVYSAEKLGGRLPLLITRGSRTATLRASLSSGFLAGGIGGSLPFLASLVIAVVREPHMEFVDGVQRNAEYYPLIVSDSWVYGLYCHSQILLLLFAVTYIFVLSGLCADLAVGVSFFTKRKYLEIPVPFILSYLMWTASDIPGHAGLSFITFLEFRVANAPNCALGAVITLPALASLILVLYAVEAHHDAC